MRCLRVFVVLLALGASLALVACGGQSTAAMCFGPRPVSAVHPVGSSISFAMTIIRDTHTYTYTYSVPKSAFGGAPATMKNGDMVTLCTATVDSGGQNVTTITQFGDQSQSVATATDSPTSR
ncbi:MAG TPA: hypothetical protein VJO13_01000 [Ktedonobacterales bacterium]|nr:hypothetical protein [Ktedonobacterales bacterium]